MSHDTHLDQIYLPMAYIYGTKSTGKITPLIKELREVRCRI